MPSNFNQGSTGTGFVGLQDYLSSNQNATNDMAGTLAGGDSAEAQKAKGLDDQLGQEAYGQSAKGGAATDPTSLPDFAKAQTTSQQADRDIKGLGTFGGDAAQLRSQYGQTAPYSAGDNALDANLLAGSAGAQSQFQGVKSAAQSKYGGLDDYLGGTAEMGHNEGAWANSRVPQSSSTPHGYSPPAAAPAPLSYKAPGTGAHDHGAKGVTPYKGKSDEEVDTEGKAQSRHGGNTGIAGADYGGAIGITGTGTDGRNDIGQYPTYNPDSGNTPTGYGSNPTPTDTGHGWGADDNPTSSSPPEGNVPTGAGPTVNVDDPVGNGPIVDVDQAPPTPFQVFMQKMWDNSIPGMAVNYIRGNRQ